MIDKQVQRRGSEDPQGPSVPDEYCCCLFSIGGNCSPYASGEHQHRAHVYSCPPLTPGPGAVSIGKCPLCNFGWSGVGVEFMAVNKLCSGDNTDDTHPTSPDSNTSSHTHTHTPTVYTINTHTHIVPQLCLLPCTVAWPKQEQCKHHQQLRAHPGSGSDIIFRLVAPPLSDDLIWEHSCRYAAEYLWDSIL